MQTNGDAFRVGMPHLDIHGLSDTFCLADAGNRHWALIARLTEKRPTEWRGELGERLYASFLYASITHRREVKVREDDTVRVDCAPSGLLAPFFVSDTTYRKPGSGTVTSIRLMSTFSATSGRSNHKFKKSAVPFRCQPFGENLIEATKGRYKEMSRQDDRDLTQKQDHLVHPLLDFNAANFMYFVNYCSLFQRYENPGARSAEPTAFREIAYFGNVDPFEQVTVLSRQQDRNVIAAMTRSSDQKCIARSRSIIFGAPAHDSIPTREYRPVEGKRPLVDVLACLSGPVGRGIDLS